MLAPSAHAHVLNVHAKRMHRTTSVRSLFHSGRSRSCVNIVGVSLDSIAAETLLSQETHLSGQRGHEPSRIRAPAGHRPEWGLPRYAIIALRAVSSATCGVGPYAWQTVWIPVR